MDVNNQMQMRTVNWNFVILKQFLPVIMLLTIHIDLDLPVEHKAKTWDLGLESIVCGSIMIYGQVIMAGQLLQT